jgi:hypothetical protein
LKIGEDNFDMRIAGVQLTLELDRLIVLINASNFKEQPKKKILLQGGRQ